MPGRSPRRKAAKRGKRKPMRGNRFLRKKGLRIESQTRLKKDLGNANACEKKSFSVGKRIASVGGAAFKEKKKEKGIDWGERVKNTKMIADRQIN